MFGILTVQVEEQQPLARRAALRLRPQKGLECSEALFRMAMFCTAQVSLCSGWRESLREKRVKAALGWMTAQGVREAVLPESWHRLARAMDILPIMPRAALEACADQAVAEACRGLELPMKQVCLAVYGREISRGVSTQLLTLAKALRTLRIYGEGNEGLRTCLWRSCGIVDRGPMPENAPVVGLLLPGGEARGETLLTVDLSAGQGAGEGLLWSPAPLPPQGAMGKLPQGADAAAFAAALLQSGAIQPREIRVSRLDIPESTQYNKETANKCLKHNH